MLTKTRKKLSTLQYGSFFGSMLIILGATLLTISLLFPVVDVGTPWIAKGQLAFFPMASVVGGLFLFCSKRNSSKESSYCKVGSVLCGSAVALFLASLPGAIIINGYPSPDRKEVYLDAKGEVIASGSYRNGLKWNGKFYYSELDAIAVFEDGKVKQIIRRDEKRKAVGAKN